MKSKKMTAACIAGTLLFSSYSNAGIPVVDIAGNLEQLQEWTAKLQQWQYTVTHYQSQLNAYKSQLATATGVRDVQAFFNQAKSLTSDLKNLQKNGVSMNDLLTNPGGQYSGALNSLYSKYSMFDLCPPNSSEVTVANCKNMVLNKAVAVEETTEMQGKINETVSDIATLASRIELSPDAKESQDLANAITTKSVQLSALTTQWEMSVKQSELRDELLKNQQQKAFRKRQSEGTIPTFN